jgi:FkbM family methyltransferase
LSAGLIYDVGMNNGDDTAYYLKSGFRVVGIEANPVMVAGCRDRFRDEVRAGQLTVVNVAIAEQDGVADFYIAEADERGALSSLDATLAARWGPVRRVQVSTRRFRGLLDEFGVPYYLKVDIEGADHLCLRDLDTERAPAYVSFEASENGIETLSWLTLAGYRRFKLIDQRAGFTQVVAPPLHSWALAQALHVALARRTLRSVPGLAPFVRRLRTFKRASAPVLSPFGLSTSGPRPDESDGQWQSLQDVTYAWLYYVRNCTTGAWYDIHATR